MPLPSVSKTRLASIGTEKRNVTDSTEVTSSAIASGGIVSKTDVSRGLGATTVFREDDMGVKPTTFTKGVDSVAPLVPTGVLVGSPGSTTCGEVSVARDRSDVDLNAGHHSSQWKENDPSLS